MSSSPSYRERSQIIHFLVRGTIRTLKNIINYRFGLWEMKKVDEFRSVSWEIFIKLFMKIVKLGSNCWNPQFLLYTYGHWTLRLCDWSHLRTLSQFNTQKSRMGVCLVVEIVSRVLVCVEPTRIFRVFWRKYSSFPLSTCWENHEYCWRFCTFVFMCQVGCRGCLLLSMPALRWPSLRFIC